MTPRQIVKSLIQDYDMSVEEIAVAVGCSWLSVRRWRDGQAPRSVSEEELRRVYEQKIRETPIKKAQNG